MEATVVIASFGAKYWQHLAETRAAPSVPEGVPTILSHLPGGTLAQTRNAGLEQVETEWVIHLDADDELGKGYIDAMATGTCDLRAPAREDVRGSLAKWAPYVPQVWGHTHRCVGECLRFGNWMTVGTCVRTDLVRSVGGWEEWGWSEDWALFARCWKAGGTVEAIPEAIYRAHFSRHSRNRVARHTGLHWHGEIERAIWPEEPSVL